MLLICVIFPTIPGPQVRSIECRRTVITEAVKGTSCTFAVRAINRKITLRKNAFRKGEYLGLLSTCVLLLVVQAIVHD